MEPRDQNNQPSSRLLLILLGALVTAAIILFFVAIIYLFSRRPSPYYPDYSVEEVGRIAQTEKEKESQSRRSEPPSNNNDGAQNESDEEFDQESLELAWKEEVGDDDYEYEFERTDVVEDVEGESEEEDAQNDARGENERNVVSVNTVVVPDEYETLAEAIEASGSGDVILLRKNSTPYQLGVSKEDASDDARGCSIKFNLTIKGETGNAEDVVVRVPREARLLIENDSAEPVVFEGVTISVATKKTRADDESASVIITKGAAEFESCAFQGVRSSGVSGILVVGEFSGVKCSHCIFQSYGGAGIWVEEDAGAWLDECCFEKRGRFGLYLGAHSCVNVLNSRFDALEFAVYASENVRGSIRDCQFYGNKENWFFEGDASTTNLVRVGNDEARGRQR